MTMIRQLWLWFIVSTTAGIFGAVFITALYTKSHIQAELSMKNQDTANSLAMVLSHRDGGLNWTQSLVDAQFETGHFEAISILNLKKVVLTQRVNQDLSYKAIPTWFVRLFPLKQEAGVAQIQNGWRAVGSIMVLSNRNLAYDTLWSITIKLVWLLSLMGVAGCLAASFVIRQLRVPLEKTVEQAKALINRQPLLLEKPKIPELEQLWRAMNTASVRLQDWFDADTARVESIRKNAVLDAQTCIFNRNAFLVRFEDMLSMSSEKMSLVITRLGSFELWQETINWQSSEVLLKRLTEAFKQIQCMFPSSVIGRLDYSEFAVYCKNSDGEMLSKILHQKIGEVYEACEPIDNGIWTAHGQFDAAWSINDIFGQMDAVLALQKMKRVSSTQCVLGQALEQSKSLTTWRETFQHALVNGWVYSSFNPVVLIGGGLLHLQSQLRIRTHETGAFLTAGHFMPIANQLQLASRLDLIAVATATSLIYNDHALPGIAIPVSIHSLSDAQFSSRLMELLAQIPGENRIWLELDECEVLSNFKLATSFFKKVRGANCLLGITNFGQNFNEFGQFISLGIHYIKLASSYGRDIKNAQNSKDFIKNICTIAHHQELLVFAEGVTDLENANILGELGVDGAGGAFVESKGRGKNVSFVWPKKTALFH